MALLIEKNTTILGSVDLTELYVRFSINYNINGNHIETFSEVYPSRLSYDSGSNGVQVDGIPFDKIFSYDRAADGSDLLTAVHNKYKTFLSTDAMKTVYVTDPSTGEVIYNQLPVLDSSSNQMTDPSTGELLWVDGDPSTMEVISIPKFAQDSSISLIDID